MTQVPGVLLEQVEQDPFQGGRRGAVPAGAGLAHLGQVMGLHDGPGPARLVAQAGQQAGKGRIRRNVPAAAVPVAPWVADVAALEAPLQPAQLDVAQVLGQLERRPAGGQAAAAEFGGGQRLEPGGQLVPEVVQVAQEDLGARRGRGGRLGKRLGPGELVDAAYYPVMGSSCHRPPLRFRLLPLVWPGALSLM
jgi:hypothetical protein